MVYLQKKKQTQYLIGWMLTVLGLLFFEMLEVVVPLVITENWLQYEGIVETDDIVHINIVIKVVVVVGTLNFVLMMS